MKFSDEWSVQLCDRRYIIHWIIRRNLQAKVDVKKFSPKGKRMNLKLARVEYSKKGSRERKKGRAKTSVIVAILAISAAATCVG